MGLASLILGSGSLEKSGLDSDELHPSIRNCALPPLPCGARLGDEEGPPHSCCLFSVTVHPAAPEFSSWLVRGSIPASPTSRHWAALPPRLVYRLHRIRRQRPYASLLGLRYLSRHMIEFCAERLLCPWSLHSFTSLWVDNLIL